MNTFIRLPRRLSIVADWIAAVPEAVSALVLVTLCMAFCLYDNRAWYFILPSIFVAGALRRRNARQILVALMLGVAAQFVQVAAANRGYPAFMGWLVPFLISLPVLFAFEWRCRPSRTGAAFGWAMGGAMALSSVLATASLLIRCTGAGVEIPVPFKGSMSIEYELDQILLPPLEGLIVWMMIWLTLDRIESSPKYGKRFALGTIVLAVAVFPATTQWGIYELARYSLAVNGPLSPESAIQLLTIRGSDDDLDLVWKSAIENEISLESSSDPYHVPTNFRQVAVDLLMKRNRAWAEPRVMALAASKATPFPYESEAFLDAVVERRAYELVPQLLKCGPGAPAESLERMSVRHVAIVLLRDEWQRRLGEVLTGLYDRTGFRGSTVFFDPNSLPEPKVSADMRRRLTLLLGRDVGPDFDAWYEFYDIVHDAESSVLPTPIAVEADRVVEALRQYDLAIESRDHLEQRIVEKNARELMLKHGYREDLKVVERLSREVRGRESMPMPTHGTDGLAFERWAWAKNQARSELESKFQPKLPSMSAVGTNEFDGDLQRVFEEIEAVETREFPVTASSPPL